MSITQTENREMVDNKHMGELFFVRMYWRSGSVPTGNIMYWQDEKKDEILLNFLGFDGLLLYLDETCERHGVLLRKSQVRRYQKRRKYIEERRCGNEKMADAYCAVFWIKVMGREFASLQGIVHIWGIDYTFRSGFELIILLKDIVAYTEKRYTKKKEQTSAINLRTYGNVQMIQKKS